MVVLFAYCFNDVLTVCYDGIFKIGNNETIS